MGNDLNEPFRSCIVHYAPGRTAVNFELDRILWMYPITEIFLLLSDGPGNDGNLSW
jgi:hypothetical protein